MARDAAAAHDGRRRAGPGVGESGPGGRIPPPPHDPPGGCRPSTSRPAGNSWRRRCRTGIMPRTTSTIRATSSAARAAGCTGCLAAAGCGHGHGCKACGGHGCGLCSGLGHGNAVADPGCGGGRCGHHRAGKFAPCDTCVDPAGVPATYVVGPVATSQSQPIGMAVVQPSGQSPCGLTGCGVQGRHLHKGLHGHGRLCGLCGGKGCGGCGGAGILAGCGDPGCGLCHGKGSGCGFCGGKGCSHCLSGLHGKLAGLLHHGRRSITSSAPAGRSRSLRDMSPTSWPRGRRATSSPSRP